MEGRAPASPLWHGLAGSCPSKKKRRPYAAWQGRTAGPSKSLIPPRATDYRRGQLNRSSQERPAYLEEKNGAEAVASKVSKELALPVISIVADGLSVFSVRVVALRGNLPRQTWTPRN